ncbi:WD repeat-containing protein mio [Plakobranchus ocellatus]|uniref:WD repeat-containing protein mio n=1 Tax=Plakobranchus ocellatus TaxID=259542 RepID=A0AAV3YME5_9GAST|nr:WD repeat-containing protein mio [Plakobranchus ocellatus]
MSGPKIDLQWSPVDDDIFVTYGTSLHLFQAKERNGSFEADENERQSISTITQLASNTELHFMKCVAWCPRPQPKNVFAVAQASGKISIIGFGNHKNEDLVGKEFNVRFNRQCNFLAWNHLETNLLAEGLDRNRNEPCVLIWDVVNSVSVESDRTRHSFSEGPVSKPYAELGSGEISSSFSWCPSDAKTFMVGMANRHLRLYDLRDINKPRLETHHKCVAGVCFEPLDRCRVASYIDSHIAIWDLRMFDRPINTITENKNVIKMTWCPTKSGVLSILCKESPTVKLHDIRHSIFGVEDIEQASVERSIQPFGKTHLSSFAWHPTHENRLLAVLPNGTLRDMTIFERIAMEWSCSSQLMMPVDKDTLRCLEKSSDYTDISTIMRQRITMNYGLQSQDVSANLKAIEGEPHLHGLWRWILNLRSVITSQQNSSSKQRTPASIGVISLLGFDREDNVTMNSEPVAVQWKASEGAKYSSRTHYKSPQRQLALQLCGWQTDSPRDKFDAFINRLVDHGDPERATAISLFYLHIKRALEILSTCSMSGGESEGKPNLQAVAMALSGFTEDRNALWRRTCGTLRYQLENPYLRAIFAFAACDDDNYEDVLNEEDMSVEDRVAFALIYLPDAKVRDSVCGRQSSICVDLSPRRKGKRLCVEDRVAFALIYLPDAKVIDSVCGRQSSICVDLSPRRKGKRLCVEDRVAFALIYLPDAKLKTYLCKLCEELSKTGDLDGILLTGMSEKGVDLLENYMDRTCDVQTAAVAAIFSMSNMVLKDKRVYDWIEGYRDLLDRWRLWHQRAQFDIVRQTFIPDFRVPPQVHVSCNFCGKQISNTQSLMNKARIMITQAFRGPQNRPKISCCQSCRKALSRCAICLSHMGTLSGLGADTTGSGVKLVPFGDWFTWCQTCRHGGHASHLTQWFREHSDCPVTGCPCKCMVQDAVSRRVPQAMDSTARNNELAIT